MPVNGDINTLITNNNGVCLSGYIVNFYVGCAFAGSHTCPSVCLPIRQ